MGVTVNLELAGFPDVQQGLINKPNFKIISDEQRLQQVVMNLLSNALKFSKKGGTIDMVVNYKIEGNTEKIGISVKDTGVGIKEEDQKKLFKLFGFIDTTKEINTKGIGLGLYIS